MAYLSEINLAIQNIRHQVSLPMECIKTLSNDWVFEKFDANKVIHPENTRVHHLYFLIEGHVCYSIPEQRGIDENIIQIIEPHQFFTIWDSFGTSYSSPTRIFAATSVHLLSIELEQFFYLKKQYAALEEWFSIQLQDQLRLASEYQFDMLYLTDDERYRKFHNFRGKLLGHMPRKLIANYLGLNMVELTRLRDKYSI